MGALLRAYIDRRTFVGTARWLAALRAADERWTFGLVPPDVPGFLRPADS